MHKSIPSRKYIITHNSLDDSVFNLSVKIEYAISVIQSIGDIIGINKSHVLLNRLDLDTDYLVNQLEKFFEEFRIVKYSCIKLEENIKKSLDSHLQVIKDYETSIKSSINNLIGKKLLSDSDKLIRSNYNSTFQFIINNLNCSNDLNSSIQTNQEIYLDNIIVGKIIQISGTFDLMILYHDQFINEFFTDYNECIRFIQALGFGDPIYKFF